jgi:hypothetical protein
MTYVSPGASGKPGSSSSHTPGNQSTGWKTDISNSIFLREMRFSLDYHLHPFSREHHRPYVSTKCSS